MHGHTHYRLHNHYHLLQYCILLLIMATGFSVFVQFTGNPQKQLQVGITTSLAYTIWGIFHHIYDRDFNWKIVVEYAGIGLFASSLLWSLLAFLN